MASSSRVTPRSPRQRSRLANTPFSVPNIDGRSAAGRRWRDLAEAVIDEFGSESVNAVRDVTGLRFAVEQAQLAVVGGDTRAREDLVRLNRILDRKEARMRDAAAAAKAKTPSLSEYIAQRYCSVEEDDIE
jgi:hypothetical protein